MIILSKNEFEVYFPKQLMKTEDINIQKKDFLNKETPSNPFIETCNNIEETEYFKSVIRDCSFKDIKKLEFNYSYKDFYKNLKYHSLISYLVSTTNLINIVFTDLSFSIKKCISDLNINYKIYYKESDNSDYFFNFNTINSFCGGFEISSFTKIYSKQELNFYFRFIMCELLSKSSYNSYLKFPIFFFDKDNGKIKESLEGNGLTILNSYNNPNSGNNVSVFKYIISE